MDGFVTCVTKASKSVRGDPPSATSAAKPRASTARGSKAESDPPKQTPTTTPRGRSAKAAKSEPSVTSSSSSSKPPPVSSKPPEPVFASSSARAASLHASAEKPLAKSSEPGLVALPTRPTVDNLNDTPSDVSSEDSVHRSDMEFVSSDDVSGDEWVEDSAVLTAPSDHFAGMPGSTMGLKRLGAMIRSLEVRATALEAKRLAKKTVA